MSDCSEPPLSGIIPPMVTPLAGDDELDIPGIEKLIGHLTDGGVSALFILGTTGEAPSLSYRLRKDLIRQTCRQVDQRLPVLVGVTDTSFVESIELAKFAAEQGARAIVLSTPYYFPAGQTELLQYFRKFVEASPLPVMLYNIPSMTKVSVEADTLAKLADTPKIIGVKDSSGDRDYFLEVLRFKKTRPDWSIFIGPEHLTAWAVSQGADGGVNGGANIYPALFTSLFHAVKDGEEQRSAKLQEIVENLQAIYSVGKYASRHIKATKSALSIHRICSDRLAQPFNHFLAAQRSEVAAILAKIDEQLLSL